MNQSKTSKHPTERLVLDLISIEWESGVRFISQSLSVVLQNQALKIGDIRGFLSSLAKGIAFETPVSDHPKCQG